jgi:hypothetical protein
MIRLAKRVRQEIVRFRQTYDVVVVSYGGSGTTVLADVLGRSLRVNAPNSERDGILHAISPTHPVFSNLKVHRAIYVFADPPRAVLSLFNRDYQSRMLVKIGSMHHNRAEYLRNIKAYTKPFTFTDLLQCGRDPFQIGRHLKNWTSPESSRFPILCLKYDALFESKSIIAEFVGSPKIAEAIPDRRPRRARLDDLKPTEREALLRLYEKESEMYSAMPDVFQPSASGLD